LTLEKIAELKKIMFKMNIAIERQWMGGPDSYHGSFGFNLSFQNAGDTNTRHEDDSLPEALGKDPSA
jgi:hypothetical protein